MGEYSHRELRARREVVRLAAVLTVVILAATALAMVGGAPIFGGIAVLAIAIAGGVVSYRGDAIVRRLEADLRAVTAETPVHRALVPEVRNTRRPGDGGAERTTPSPHSRRPRVG